MMNKERLELLRAIQRYDFAIKDLHLYLDTHPDCARALEYFHKYNQLRADAYAEYAEKYGPITPEQVKSKTRWTWVNDPWPWERSDNF